MYPNRCYPVNGQLGTRMGRICGFFRGFCEVSATSSTLLGRHGTAFWRLGSESNRRRRLCRPLGINIIRYLHAFCHTLTPALAAGVLGHPIVLLETFVDPQRHRGTLYQAANWLYVGDSRGYRRRTSGYSPRVHSPKKIFLRGLRPQARALLCQAHLAAPYVAGEHEHTLA